MTRNQKIKLLIDEGYPPKQAVAIAYEMEREGKLDMARRKRKRRVGRPRKRRVGRPRKHHSKRRKHSKRRHKKGHIPLTILKRRHKELGALIKRRGG